VRPMFVHTVGLAGNDELAETIAAAGLTVERDDLGAADLVLVADPTPERLADLDERTPGHSIFALLDGDVSELADATGRPDRVVGFRVAGKRVVEVIEGEETSDPAGQAVANFAQALRRQPVRCGCPLAGHVETLDDACAVVEAGLAEVRSVDLACGGLFAAADEAGLETISEPPPLVRRLLAQGRTGKQSGQGFYAYPPAGDGPVIADPRGDVTVLWLAGPPANSLSPEMLSALRVAWDSLDARAVVIASANPALFCAGADIKAFAQMDDPAALLDGAHGLLLDFEASRIATVAAVNGLALGGGCELAMGCDVRIVAESATFGQPEINLGIIPGFGGTQRLPRLVGEAKALEMNLTGESISAADAYAHGLANDVVADHELFDTALAWARKLAGQAPVAVEQVKRASRRGIDAEKAAFATAFASEDAREGVDAFLHKRRPRWSGR
jgi:enoyl-CoA hydratase/carnithine racemase